MLGNLRNVVSCSWRAAGLTFVFGLSLVGQSTAQAPDPKPVAGDAVPAAPKTPAAAVAYAPPRITEKDEKSWRSTQQIKFQNALKSIAPTNAETKILVDGANLFVDKMTIPKYLPDLYRNVIDPAKRTPDGQLTSPLARQIILKAITARSAELLAETPPHHPDIQLGVILMLGGLNAQPGATNTPVVPFTGSHKVLISVLEDATRPLQCRIHAAAGLGRIGREAAVGVPGGDLAVLQRNDIAASLSKVLVATDSQGPDEGKVWFRGRVAEALGDCGVAFDLNGRSDFIDNLMTTATNPAESRRVRATAIRAVTQLNWNGTVNVPLILHETTKQLSELATAYNAAIAAKKGPGEASTGHTNLDLYLSFRPMTAYQSSTLKWGLLNQVTRAGVGQHDPAVKAAYAVALPVINHIVSNPKTAVPIPAAQLAALDAWIQANVPADRKPTTASPKAVP